MGHEILSLAQYRLSKSASPEHLNTEWGSRKLDQRPQWREIWFSIWIGLDPDLQSDVTLGAGARERSKKWPGTGAGHGFRALQST